MADIIRTGSASWNGDLLHGQGTTSTGSGGIRDLNYSFRSRFENGTGTNPEELIAAAHAACFTMALSKTLADQGHSPQSLSTKASLTLAKTGAGFKISKVHLETEGKVGGLDAKAFRDAAEQAKENCPVSTLLKPGLESITLGAKLLR